MPLVVTATPPDLATASLANTTVKRLTVGWNAPEDPDNAGTVDETIAYFLIETSTDALFATVEAQRTRNADGQSLTALHFEEHFVVNDDANRYARITPFSADNVAGGAVVAGPVSVPQSGPLLGTTIDIPAAPDVQGFHVDDLGNFAVGGADAIDVTAYFQIPGAAASLGPPPPAGDTVFWGARFGLPVGLEDGSALGSPLALAFKSDGNLGLRRMSEDTMALVAGAADALSVSPTATTFYVDAQFEAGPHVSVEAFGALGLGSDYTTQIAAAFSQAVALGLPVRFGDGDFGVTTTVGTTDASPSFFGTGINTTHIVWNGNNTTPVFKFSGAHGLVAEGMTITGQPGTSAAKALAAIEFSSTSGHACYLNTVRNMQIGTVPGGTQDWVFQNAILLSGGVNNDGHRLADLRLTWCDTGINVSGTQMIDNAIDNVRTVHLGTAFDLQAHTTLRNLELAASTVTDFNVDQGAIVVAEQVTSEGGARFVRIAGGSSSFTGRSGYFQQTSSLGSPQALTAATAAGTVATYTTAAAHGYVVGGPVFVAGVTPADYNGTWQVTATTSTTFTATIATSPAAATAFGTVASAAFIWGINSSQGQAVTLEDFHLTAEGGYAGPAARISLKAAAGGSASKVLTLERVKGAGGGSFTETNLDVNPVTNTDYRIVQGTVFDGTASRWRSFRNELTKTTDRPSFTTFRADVATVAEDISVKALDTATRGPSGTVAETSLLDSTYALPAETDKIYRISLKGKYGCRSVNPGDTVTISVKAGAAIVLSKVITMPTSSATTGHWRLEADVRFTTTGAGGTGVNNDRGVMLIDVYGATSTGAALPQGYSVIQTGSQVVDLTTSPALDVTATWSNANASNLWQALTGSVLRLAT